MSAGTPLLEIVGYTLDYETRVGAFRTVEDVSLQVGPGEVLGLVATGCGFPAGSDPPVRF
jgi:ABC-type glutathione transport system ATPase component